MLRKMQELASDIYHHYVTSHPRDITTLPLELLYSEFESTVKSLPEIAQMLDRCITEATPDWLGGMVIEEDDGTIYTIPKIETSEFPINNFINSSLRALNKKRKKRWLEEVNSSLEIWKQHPLAKLGFYFKQVYPTWLKASQYYKYLRKSPDRKDRQKWRQRIKDKYELINVVNS